MAQNPNRPLSPHLGIYQKGAHMMASITHRITGFVIATVGMLTLLWWIASIAGGAESYASFQTWTIDAGKEATGWQTASNWFFRFVAVGVLWSFFQHFFSGIRHLLMDLGAGYELKTNRTWAIATYIASITATGLVLLYVANRMKGA